MRNRLLLEVVLASVVAVAAVSAVAPTPVSAAQVRVLMIGDSTLAALDWYQGTQRPLADLDYTLRAASCRAVTGPSCLGRPNAGGARSRPSNALSVLRSYPPDSFDELVLMVGYDEGYSTFEKSVALLPQVARDYGIDHITWLTFRTNVDYSAPDDVTTSYYGNNRLLVAAADSAGGFIDLLDWNWHVRNNSGLVERDGVHLTTAGATSVATLIRQAVINQWGSSATVANSAGPPASGSTGTTTSAAATGTSTSGSRSSLGYGATGDAVKRAQRLLIAVGSPQLARHGPTGRYFAVTRSAVEAFQQSVKQNHDASMVVDGIIGPATWRYLEWLGIQAGADNAAAPAAPTGPVAPTTPASPAAGSATATGNTGTLGYGAIGPAVAEIQEILLRIGAPLLEPHGATGRYFAATRDSVKYFQQMVKAEHDSSMVVDGIVGASTRRWLDELDPG